MGSLPSAEEVEMTIIIMCGVAMCMVILIFALAVVSKANGHNQEWEDDRQMQYLMDWSAQRARERDLFKDAAE